MVVALNHALNAVLRGRGIKSCTERRAAWSWPEVDDNDEEKEEEEEGAR